MQHIYFASAILSCKRGTSIEQVQTGLQSFTYAVAHRLGNNALYLEWNRTSPGNQRRVFCLQLYMYAVNV